jgi:hypothetical protein
LPLNGGHSEGVDDAGSDAETFEDGPSARSSFDRSRGFSGRSLSLKAPAQSQWASSAARGRPCNAPLAPTAASRGTMLPAGGATDTVGQSQPRARPTALIGGNVGCASVTPATGPQKPQQPPPRRPRPTAMCATESVDEPGEGPQLHFSGRRGDGHSTPFAELIARRGGEPTLGTAGVSDAHGDEPGLVAGLELLVSHVRRPLGGDRDSGLDSSGGAVAYDTHPTQPFASRSKSSPVAGRRALPPSATATPPIDPLNAHHAHDSLGASDVDDAIFSFAASLRQPRRPPVGMAGEGGDDEIMCCSGLGGGGLGGTLPMQHVPGLLSRTGGGLGATLPNSTLSGAPGSALPLYGSCQQGQPLSAAARQRWSAREQDRAAPCHSVGPFSKEHLVPGASSVGGPMSQHGAPLHSHSRPRSVEGSGRSLDPRGADVRVGSRRATYSSQPHSGLQQPY